MTSEPNSPDTNTAEQAPLDEEIMQSEDAEEVNELVDDEDIADENDIAIELAKAQVTIKDYWDQIMHLNADIENNRKRAQRDIENAHKFAVKNFAESLLPIADSMEMGLNAAEGENTTIESIKEGISMTLELFQKTMEKNGIFSVDPTGEKFDPELHQAMSMQEDDSVDSNTVLTVMQKGYLLNDRLVRPAMVIVSKKAS